jgi:hypothetical protein
LMLKEKTWNLNGMMEAGRGYGYCPRGRAITSDG